MTVKRQWLFVLIIIAVISVVINTFVLSNLTNQYFKDYMKNNYDQHFNQVVEYLTETLKDKNYSSSQISIDLETHLVDPITRIKVYDLDGNLISDVSTDAQSYVGNSSMNGMMSGMMGNRINSQSEEVDHAQITDNGKVIGQVNITKYSSAENSATIWAFQYSLLENSIISIVIVLIVAIGIGILVSRRMSRDLIHTSEMAQNLDIGKDTPVLESRVKEIQVIQQSLESLKTRLNLKQKSRKTLIDELVHQTRTPLTILRTHLEGMEDGILEFGPEEIQVCENQIDNITAIITNMSNMIDAEGPENALKIEEFELNQLIRQIMNGLKAQFEKKNIDVSFVPQDKVIIKTDKYRLSQTVYNLLTNAYKFTKQYGSVRIAYHINQEVIVLSIEDNGAGIEKKDLDKIFQAYYKSDKSPGLSGDGLGLYIAKENMTSIHGTIEVESELDKGSKFILTFPQKIK
ncbi:sensor histidine kinase [Anaerocolumna chitinilytica]|uniref:histidine kinase n=1 Tax=Anaerocolumna chitinilytica TaxID=1727145 RepID=A0A7I8DRJ5_9FIRM|nr:HAMP domain-containing sensor histidine kinase [Anaerocolumna chitinilytica]BCK01039.1 two-component sensor histidine kinase [Anaerocolumna chitinilytica]